MNAVVVYESLWGNTAQIAAAIAEGIGPDARAVCTEEATPEVLAEADLVVAGAPLLGFNLPTNEMRQSIGNNPTMPAADLGHPSMRGWLAGLPKCTGRCAAFETRIWWSPGSSAKKIAEGLQAAGYNLAAKPQPFMVTGRYGPLKDGEIERARQWGAALAQGTA